MKKRQLMTICAVLLCLVMIFSLCACNPQEQPSETNPPSGGSSETNPPSGGGSSETNPPSGGETKPPVPTTPTSAQVVSAISEVYDSNEQNYDFTLNLAGNVTVGLTTIPDANANYVCNYRYNKATGDLKFKRVTSGILLYDSTEYIYSVDDTRVTIKMDENGKVKKAMVNYEDEQLHLVNLPFAALLGALTENMVKSITKVSGDVYKANLEFSSDNAALGLILNLIGKMDTTLNFKGVKFDNPVSGLTLEFTYVSGKVTKLTLTTNVEIPVKGATVELALTYSQQPSTTPVVIPATAGLVMGSSAIGTELTAINNALDAVKQEAAYSLDVNAENEMDPGWNVGATTDTYKARMYKNTVGDFTSFNKSFVYHSHTEEKGKETYKYTIGNIQTGETWLITRYGTNKQDQLTGVTADSLFDETTELFRFNASQVDCLKKVSSGGTTTYTVYLKNSAIVQLSQGIVDVLNGNSEDGVITVNNYFNSEDYTVEDASLTVVVTDGKLVSMKLATTIKYNPIAGDYTENNVTLDNVLNLTVNDNLKGAQKYEAPKSVDTPLTGLNSFKQYIL